MKEKIERALKEAMKARKQDVVTTLRGLMAEIKRVEVDTRKDVSESDILGILQKEIKKRRDALEFAEKAGRDDLVEQNNAELALIQDFVGKPLSEEELRALITKLVSDGADNIGKIMGPLNAEYKGRFDGKLASTIAKEMLG